MAIIGTILGYSIPVMFTVFICGWFYFFVTYKIDQYKSKKEHDAYLERYYARKYKTMECS
jgi:hypothetical protein